MLKFSRLACAPISAARMSFVEVLPVEPVTPTTGTPSARRHSRATSCSARCGSAATITTALAQAESPTAPSTAASAASRYARPDEHAPGALLERAGRELAAVRTRAPQAHEQVALPDGARVDQDPLRPSALGRPGDELTARRLGKASGAQVDHAPPPAGASRARSASRATSRSSNGSLRPFSNS